MTIRLGFIGTGTISEAIIRGLLNQPTSSVPRILVSPRNAEIAGRLADEFAAVEIAADNQAVADNADLLFLAIRPQIAEQVIRALRIKPGQRVVSLIAATGLDSLREWIAVDASVTQAIPLPFVAQRSGVTAIYPPDAQVAALFDSLGNAVQCDTKEEYDLLAAASALMSTYFGILDTASAWLVDKGLAADKAQAYLSPLFASLSQTAVAESGRTYATLSSEFATKGGLNEQVLQDFARHGGTAALGQALEGVLVRIKG